MRSFNLHPLFTATIAECYEQHISLSVGEKTELMGARTTIRAHIRSQLPKRLAAARVEEGGDRIEPRFITQGSYAYGLINAPAYPPRQQSDLDDGVYVPLSFCEDTGSPKASGATSRMPWRGPARASAEALSAWSIRTSLPPETWDVIVWGSRRCSSIRPTRWRRIYDGPYPASMHDRS